MSYRISEKERAEMVVLFRNNVSLRKIGAFYGWEFSNICKIMINLGAKRKTINEILMQEFGYNYEKVPKVSRDCDERAQVSEELVEKNDPELFKEYQNEK